MSRLLVENWPSRTADFDVVGNSDKLAVLDDDRIKGSGLSSTMVWKICLVSEEYYASPDDLLLLLSTNLGAIFDVKWSDVVLPLVELRSRSEIVSYSCLFVSGFWF